MLEVTEIKAKKVTAKARLKDGDAKKDEKKLRYDLIPIEPIEGLAQILTYGSLKYDDNNWLKSDHPERYYAALFRHLAEIRKGKMIDPESSLLHLDHAFCCLMMYRELLRKKGIFKQL